MCSSFSHRSTTTHKGHDHVTLGVVFLIIALIAGVFGFTRVYVAAAGIARILFFIFLVLLVISLLFGLRGPPVT